MPDRVQRWIVKVMVRKTCLSIAWYLGTEAHLQMSEFEVQYVLHNLRAERPLTPRITTFSAGKLLDGWILPSSPTFSI